MIPTNFAVYPLLQTDFQGVHRAIDAVREGAVEVSVGAMGTTVIGEPGKVFAALHKAFDAARETGPTVMTVTVTNACPLPAAED